MKGEGKMSLEKAKEFLELINTDEKLQEKINEAAKAFTGDKKDEKAVFDAVIIPVAKEAGYEFSFEDAAEIVKDAGEGELSEDELKKAAGGGFCMVIGGSTKRDVGAGLGFGACKYVGVGIGGFITGYLDNASSIY